MAKPSNKKKRSLLGKIFIGAPLFVWRQSFEGLNLKSIKTATHKMRTTWHNTAPRQETFEEMAKPMSKRLQFFTCLLILGTLIGSYTYLAWSVYLSFSGDLYGGIAGLLPGVIMSVYFSLNGYIAFKSMAGDLKEDDKIMAPLAKIASRGLKLYGSDNENIDSLKKSGMLSSASVQQPLLEEPGDK